ncbi:MAG: serine hydrolase [Lewinella sp.]|nr:serine hydrolase [Lewinella sp.]
MLVPLLASPLTAQRNVLERIIRQTEDQLSAWAQDPGRYEVQVLYTQIDRDEMGRPSFTTYRYGVDPNRYFYPASTVKMPAAFLALEKLNRLGVIGLDRRTHLRISAGHDPQTAVLTDPSAADLLPSIGHYIRKIFLVSDNDAFNRLYEFLGQRYLNEQLREKGYTESRIIHRLSVTGFDTLGNRHTNPLTFYDEQGQTLYQQGEVYSAWYDDFGLSQQLRGQGYINDEGAIIREPFDFRYKNYLSIQDLHDMLQAVIFPRAVAPEARFGLTTDDYRWLYRAMAEFPAESDDPDYSDKPDNYVKFWIYGDRDSTFQIPRHIRSLNKVGWAYGFLTDAAYIVDLEAGIEFFLVGTIHVNDNQTYNDGVYEYEEVGLPFFGELGRAVYAYELERRRRHAPDLDWLRELLGQ